MCCIATHPHVSCRVSTRESWHLQASDYVLVGNSVAPGLEDPDYELGNRTELLQLYPQHSSTIDLLLPED